MAVTSLKQRNTSLRNANLLGECGLLLNSTSELMRNQILFQQGKGDVMECLDRAYRIMYDISIGEDYPISRSLLQNGYLQREQEEWGHDKSNG
ncbi:uncharacterized protein G2W53_018416 [Senna tora]|uniref:Uncharacterized protein n=1 Tax=Senna tora TaxID=362788 RepID=A0A834TSI1_9FABA|nr:uncharacterized protein G2W53_018416 [Senna tora]